MKTWKPSYLFVASKPHSLSSSGSSDQSALSANVLPDGGLCLVCCAHSSASCTVCEQDFCINHLYVCLDCDSQFCGGCLDDHRAEGHWTDSDTNAELSHGWKENLVSNSLRIGTNGSSSALNRTGSFCGNQFAYQSHSSVIRVLPNEKASKASGDGFGSSPVARKYCAMCTYPNQALAYASHARSRPSFRIPHSELLRRATSCFTGVIRSVCSCVAAHAIQALVNSFSQFQSLEVCL